MRERQLQDVERFIESLAAFFARDTQCLEFPFRNAASEPDRGEPSIRNDIEIRDVMRQPNGMPPRSHRNHRPESDAVRARRKIHQCLDGIGRHPIRRATVFRRPDAIESQRLGEVTERECRLHEFPVGCFRRTTEITLLHTFPVLGVVREDSQVHLHHSSPERTTYVARCSDADGRSAAAQLPAFKDSRRSLTDLAGPACT